MPQETGNIERNRFEFNRLKNGDETDVLLDLTTLTDELWQERVLPHFDLAIMQGTRNVTEKRVIYNFRLSNEMAHILETAIVNAMIQIQGQTN